MQNKYRWGLYYDPSDPRLVVPKSNPAFGWTLNVAHQPARIILFLLVASIIVSVVASVINH
jgi:uncharacterized membrane protein